MLLKLCQRPLTSRISSLKHWSVYYSSIMMNSSVTNSISSFETSIDGDKIHYQSAGNGPHHLLLLPGALGSATTDFLPQLSKLNGDIFTIHCWDPPGYGKSRPPNRSWPDKFFNRDATSAANLIRNLGISYYILHVYIYMTKYTIYGIFVILKQVVVYISTCLTDVGNMSLVGWSDGGITALVMAVLYPHLINKMVLFGCNSYITETDVKYIEGKSNWFLCRIFHCCYQLSQARAS